MAHVLQDRYRGHLAVVLLGQIDRGLQGLFTATRIVQRRRESEAWYSPPCQYEPVTAQSFSPDRSGCNRSPARSISSQVTTGPFL